MTRNEFYLIFIEREDGTSPTPPADGLGKLFFIRKERAKDITKTKIKDAEKDGHLEQGKTIYICLCGSMAFKEEVKEAAEEEIRELKKFARMLPKEFDEIDDIYNLPCYISKPVKPEMVHAKPVSNGNGANHSPTMAEKIREALPKGSKLTDSDIYIIVISIQQVLSSKLSPCTPLTQYEYFKMLINRYAVGDGRAEKIIKEVEEGDNIIGKISQVLGTKED